MEGYIKLYRKILNNPVVMKDAEYLAVFIYLLLNATHKEHETLFNGNSITLNSGQLITGRNSISEELKVNSSKVQRILNFFQKNKIIEQQTSNKNRLITITKWELYQFSEQQLNNKRTTTEQQSEHKQECNNKNEKNIKEKNNQKRNYFESDDLNGLFVEFLEVRKKLKAVNSDRAIMNLINKLSKYDDETKIKMINRSITNSWKDVYEIKESKQIKRKEPEWIGKKIEEEYLSDEQVEIMDKLLRGEEITEEERKILDGEK